MDSGAIKDAIHAISSALEIPTIILLILAVLFVLYELGSIIAEYFVERIKKKPNVIKVLEEISGKSAEEKGMIIKDNPFQIKQKIIFNRMLKNSEMPDEDQRRIATQLFTEEEIRLNKRLVVTDIIARIAPMFGLLGTLIPLGPGLIALGQGDTHALADSLLTAFDTTIAGLITASMAYIISKVRKRWYQSDISIVESILEGIIE